jgi:two-component system chemotaxis response regulator CheY
MRAFVRASLEAHEGRLGPVQLVEASGGFEALRLLPRGPYNLVITDINMPDINGLELLSFIRNSDQHRGTPVVIISTQTSPKDRERGLSLGANAYLEKPFSADTLVEEIAKHLAGAGVT